MLRSYEISMETNELSRASATAATSSMKPEAPLRIAFIIHNQAETGPYWKVVEQCAAYVRLGHTADVYCTSKTARLQGKERVIDGVRVIEAPDALWGKLRQGVDLWNALWRCWRLGRERYDVVHAVDCRPNVIFPSLYVQRTQRIPLVLAWWDLFGSDSKRFGEVYALTAGKIEGLFEEGFRSYADGAIAITSYLAKRLERLGFPPENIIVQHLGCDTSAEPIRYEDARTRLLERHGIPRDRTVFCFAGTIYETDFALLTQALDILQARGVPYTLLWIGKHTLSVDVCERYHIKHLGIVPTMREVYEYFAAADACLLPMEVNLANTARWHSKVTDYLNAGAPVALTPVSDFPAYFIKHSIGWLAASGTPQDYALTLLQAIADKPYRDEKSRAARAFMRQELDVMAIAERAIAFYRLCAAKLL